MKKYKKPCPKCGKLLYDSRREKCWNCYVKEKKSQAELKKKYCPGCGQELGDRRTSYCFNCWWKIRPRKEGVYDKYRHRMILCPFCKENLMHKDSKMCNNCTKEARKLKADKNHSHSWIIDAGRNLDRCKCGAVRKHVHHWIIDDKNFGRCDCGAEMQFPTQEEILRKMSGQKKKKVLERTL